MSSLVPSGPQFTESCRKKYPHMVPISVVAEEGIYLHKRKFLISQNLTGLELQRNVLKFAQREVNQTLFFFIEDGRKHRMLQTSVPVRDIYALYQDGNGFLNLKILKENVF